MLRVVSCWPKLLRRKWSRKRAYDLVKTKNRGRKQSHKKGDGIGVGRTSQKVSIFFWLRLRSSKTRLSKSVGTYTKTLAKIQVRGTICIRDIRRNVLPKLIRRFVWRRHAGTHLVELQHGGRKRTATAKFERWFNGKEVKLDEDNNKRLPHDWLVRSFCRGGSTGGVRGPAPPLIL